MANVEIKNSGRILFSVLGVATIALGIVGLAETTNLVQMYLDAVAVIVLSVALLGTGTQLFRGYAQLLIDGAKDVPAGSVMVAVYIGISTLILGVLALLQVVPDVLIAVAVLTLGVGVIFASLMQARLNSHLLMVSGTDDQRTRVLQELAIAGASPQVAAGLAAAILGILAIVGFYPLVLTLVAVIVLGVSSLLNGAAFGQRLVSRVAGA